MSNQSFNNSLPTDQAFTGIENRNFLSPIGFKFNIGKMKGVDFFCQAACYPCYEDGRGSTRNPLQQDSPTR